jgi:hypothetical protein
LWDARNDTCIKTFTGHRNAVTGVAFRSGSFDLYSVSTDRSVSFAVVLISLFYSEAFAFL